MTEPTPAQTEAAAVELSSEKPRPRDCCLEIARLRLTAAASVGELDIAAVDAERLVKNWGSVYTSAYKKAYYDLLCKELASAAAEVGNAMVLCPYCSNGKHTGLPGNACENCMNTGYITAAADVGEQADIDDLSFQLRAVKVELRLAEEQIERTKAATIERCAQVAENGNDGVGAIRLQIAAAIRELKEDKP